MIHTQHLIKVTAAWTSIVYTICFVGVALFPTVRPGFMMYAVHMNANMGQNVLTFGTFVSGLIIWNIVALFSVWLFTALWNGIKK